jgi:hypothetical protein
MEKQKVGLSHKHAGVPYAKEMVLKKKVTSVTLQKPARKEIHACETLIKTS